MLVLCVQELGFCVHVKHPHKVSSVHTMCVSHLLSLDTAFDVPLFFFFSLSS